ncbi:MAG: nucleoside triphosphate pyrophosphohydrolase family protein [Lactovum sp.]
MELNDYQKEISRFDLFQREEEMIELNFAFLDKVLGLSGESGEVADKIKKIIRDKEGKISDKDRKELSKELGDVFWYLTTVADYLGLHLEEIAKENIQKLEKRQLEGKISGSGDNR